MAAPRFVSHFWGENGFQTIEKRLEQGMKSSDLFCYYIAERASMEKQYSEKLARLLRNVSQATEVGSSREAWLALKGETDNLANLHMEFAQSLVQEIGQPMVKFKEDQKKLRKQYLADAFKLNREMSKMRDFLEKVRERYVKLSEMAETQESTIEQMKGSGAPQKRINKEISKLQQMSKQAMDHEHAYQEQVAKLAAFQVEWVEKISGILEFLQIQEESRIDNLKENMAKLVEVQQRVAPFLGEACKRINVAVSKIDKVVDISEFIKEFGTGEAKPEPPVFQPYRAGGAGGYDAAAASGGGGGAMPAMGGGGGAAAYSPPMMGGGGGGGGGIAPMGGIAPAMGGRSGPELARPAAAFQNFQVRALYDYVGQDATELDFFANDQITVIGQDESGWWTGRIDGREGLFPSK